MIAKRAHPDDGRHGVALDAVNAEVARILALFDDAALVEPAALLPSDVLVDLYGEDLRARGGSFEVESDPALEGGERVHPDAAQAILPLLQNALDAAGEAGQVRLRVGL